MNPYDVLEISPGASADEIKAAYHRLAKQWHPDRFTGAAKEEAENRFRILAEAFSMLKDAGRREEAERKAAAAAAAAASVAQPVPAVEPIPVVTAPRDRSAGDWYNDAKAAFEKKDYERTLGLVHYAIRMDAERSEYHLLLADALGVTGGDKKLQVKALETAVRLNPRDVEAIIKLAELFQTVGMYARATRMWETARNLAPGHKVFAGNAEPGKIKGKEGKDAEPQKAAGLGEQWAQLVERIKGWVNLKMGRS
jgi:curved DNA-binding protein CbpA